MQDIIEGNDIPLWRLISIALRALAMLVAVALTPKSAVQDDLSGAC